MNKNITLWLILALALSSAFAQETSFGLRYSLTFNNVDMKEKSDTKSSDNATTIIDNTATVGFKFGSVVNLGVSRFFYVQPGLMFSQKGGEVNKSYYGYGNYTYSDMDIYKLYYIELPVMFSLKIPAGNMLSLSLNAGPYFALGLSGKTNTVSYVEGIDTEIAKKFNRAFSKNNLRRFDSGLSIGGGIEFESIYVGTSYEFGFLDIARSSNSNKAKNDVVSITVGYDF